MNALMKILLPLLLLAVLAQSGGSKQIKDIKYSTYDSADCTGTDTFPDYLKSKDPQNKTIPQLNEMMKTPYPINGNFDFFGLKNEKGERHATTKLFTCNHQKFFSADILPEHSIVFTNAESGYCMKTGEKSSEKVTWEGACQGGLSGTDIGLTVVGVFLALTIIGGIVYVFCCGSKNY